jgi:putative CRISPR-associated protein (TIGR02620 family)
MTTWFVSRHKGAIQWANSAGIKVASKGIVSSLDIEQVRSGDNVVGTLPINLAAEVARRGAHYEHLALDLPDEARGQELSAEDMRRYGARLEHYHIELLGQAQQRSEWDGNDDYVMLVVASAQTLPNVLPILARNTLPKMLYIVVSKSAFAKQAAQTIAHIAGLLAIPVKYLDDAPTAPLSSVQEFAEDKLKTIRKKFPAARIVLNATGGTKIMSNGFSRAVGVAGEIIYCDTENDCIEYFSPQGRKPDVLQPELLDLQTYLLSKGVKITHCASSVPGWMETARSREKLTRHFVKKLAGHSPEIGVNAIGYLNLIATQALPVKKQKNGGKAKPWEPIQNFPLSKDLAGRIEEYGIWEQLPDKKIKFTDESFAEYIRGGWLEEYAALTMEQLGVDQKHWGVGVKITPLVKDAEEKSHDDLNELDLAVVWRNRLLVIECKTGKQVQGGESQDILNKLEAIRSYAAGSFGQFWLLSVRFADSIAVKRANEYRIELHEREAIALLPELIADWMRLNNADQKGKLQAKLEMLNKRDRS